MRKTEMMALKTERMRKIHVKDLNDLLICTLCNGYLIDATSLVECHHVFCRGCILRHFENSKTGCPTCNTVYKKKNHTVFRADPQIQAVVYKVVPGLYSKEMQRREDFYRSSGVRASSSCSDDSVLERERDLINEEDALMIQCQVGDKTEFYGPEDLISLSLEYYQQRLDKIALDRKNLALKDQKCDLATNHKMNGSSKCNKEERENDCKDPKMGDKRFLQGPAAVSMKHLQKFVRMKFALTSNHKVDIIYKGEVLPEHFTLMDVAYTFKWKRLKPLRFFYRIFTPLKIQPIKIVNTTLSTGGKQLQIVPAVKNTAEQPKIESPQIKEECTKEQSEEKERLLAHLQLQSRTKVQNHESVPAHKSGVMANPPAHDCVFDYEEPDKEEIKRFAEIRDREWALQKKLDESRDDDYHHFSKKRKKNKHNKNDFMYRKRKLHAEITNKEEELKLKVKLTQPNGHKHKHHKSSSSTEMSSKEKLLQMRQVRHKHISSEDKNIQTAPSGSVSKETITECEAQQTEIRLTPPPPPPPKPQIPDLKIKTVDVKPEDVNKPLESTKPVNDTKTALNKEWTNRVPTVQIERNELTEQQAKKTFSNKATDLQNKKTLLKTFQSYTDKKNEKLNVKIPTPVSKPPTPQPRPPSQLERKIANLQQRCTVETKTVLPKTEVKTSEKKSDTPYPSGFTVSKIEAGTKRKIEGESSIQDKRPSLEITLINPQTSAGEIPKPQLAPPAKRPPPPTIPLDRIKKSLNLKSGISIIPKVPPEKCDNIGALDLSKPSSKVAETDPKPSNGFSMNKEGRNVNMSNLQMLSKVATEHLKPKPRPQIPNLQTIKPPQSQAIRIPNLDKLPKLTEISKAQFRMSNPQIRNLRPNQNQNIRNIPNPSLLVRQQNQNRLNSMNPVNNNTEKEKTITITEPEKVVTKPASEAKDVSA